MKRMHFALPLLFASALSFAVPAWAIEEPAYRVVRNGNGIEVREYAPYLVAEIRVDGDFADAGNQAFSPLFKFISGNNRRREAIAMTAPVSQSAAAGEKIDMTAPVTQRTEPGPASGAASGYRVSFAMPAKFRVDTVPQPEDPRVAIREIPARHMAVLAYSGTWTESRFAEHTRQLLEAVANAGLQARGSVEFARYNAPFVPWFLRRNEVMVEIDPQPNVGKAPAG